MDRAKGTVFSKRLGDESYIFWSETDIVNLMKKNKLVIDEILSLEYANLYIVKRLD